MRNLITTGCAAGAATEEDLQQYMYLYHYSTIYLKAYERGTKARVKEFGSAHVASRASLPQAETQVQRRAPRAFNPDSVGSSWRTHTPPGFASPSLPTVQVRMASRGHAT